MLQRFAVYVSSIPRHTPETAAELSHSAETGKHLIPSALHSAWVLDSHGTHPKSQLNMISLKQISGCNISTRVNYLQASIQNPFVKCFILYRCKLKIEMVMWNLLPNHQDLLTLKLSMILFSKASMTLTLRSYLEIIATLCMKMFSS